MATPGILTLPLEIQAEILKGPLTHDEYLTHRLISKEFTRVVNRCLEVINRCFSFGRKALCASMVMPLEVIQTIVPVIRVKEERQFLQLAHHPTLTETRYDLTKLVKSNNAYFELIICFLNRRRWQSSSLYYNYTFTWENSWQVKIIKVSTGNTLVIQGKQQDPNLDLFFFYQTLDQILPIHKYTCNLLVPLDDIKSLGYLEVVTIIYVPLERKEEHLESFVWNLFSTPITRYRVIGIQEEGYDDFLTALIFSFPFLHTTYPYIREFFPASLNLEVLDTVTTCLPNLEVITLTLSSILNEIAIGLDFNLVETYLLKYPRIAIVDNQSVPFDPLVIRELFPSRLRSRIYFL